MKLVDFGSAMGYFSLPMAEMTGNTGNVYCFDIQERMLKNLVRRSQKANLNAVIEPCLITENNTFDKLFQTIDFTLLFAVAHEVPDQEKLFDFLFRLGKPGATLFFAEPKGHVNLAAFNQSVDYAVKSGFIVSETLKVTNSHAVLLKKKSI
jgi:2-polyprenyl-3-methyl-5-hydroxy-6-metoxy-1,4-benzoquinol methylase